MCGPVSLIGQDCPRGRVPPPSPTNPRAALPPKEFAILILDFRHTPCLTREEAKARLALPRPTRRATSVVIRRRAGQPEVRRTMASLGHRFPAIKVESE